MSAEEVSLMGFPEKKSFIYLFVSFIYLFLCVSALVYCVCVHMYASVWVHI